MGGLSEFVVRVYKVAALHYTSFVWTHVACFCLLDKDSKEKGGAGDKEGGDKGGNKKGGGEHGGGGGIWKGVFPRPLLGCLPLSVLSTSSEQSHNLMTFSAFVAFQFV